MVMNTCSQCNKKPKLPPAVLEVINNEPPVLFHKVVFPASLGDDKANPPETLNYKNVLLNFEANNHSYLYSSDGVPTFISMGELDVDTIMAMLKEHGLLITELQGDVSSLQADLNEEIEAREQADIGLTNKISMEESARVDADKQLQNQITTNTQNISTLETNLSDITSELQTDIANEALARANADNSLQQAITAETSARQNADTMLQTGITTNTTAINNIKNNLDVYVEKETEFNGNDSTLDVVHTKINMSDNTTQETTDALPVASTTSAGIMNAATFSAVQENSENIDSILVGAVALIGLPETPTQTQLTDQWKTTTGKTELINRASIYDVTNQKIWNYYDNTGTWYSAGAGQGSTVTVNQATNDSLGIVKGSTNLGQNFVEADGTLSLNGWDESQQNIANLTSKLNETADQLEETQKDANDALADIAAIQADYVSKTKVVDQYSTATDEVNSASFINNILNGSKVAIGLNATNSSTGVAIGNNAAANTAGISIGRNAKSTATNSITIGNNATSNQTHTVTIGSGANTSGYDYAIAIGYSARVYRDNEVSFTNNQSTSTPHTTFIANVTAGELDTDAVNVKQMEDYVMNNAITETDFMTAEEFNAAWEAV